MNVSKKIQHQLVRESGFDKAFNECLADGLDQKTAFEILNTLYRVTYGIPRYSSYDSYRITRSKRIKNSRN